MKRLIFLLTLVIFTAAAVSAQKNETAAIRKIMEEQAAAWNRGDLDAFMLGYWRSDKLAFVSGDTVTRGWQQTLDNYKKSYDTKAKMGTLTFSDLEINVLSKDAASVLGSWSLKRETDNPKGKFTLLWRKFREGWRIVHDHSS
ncbi:MAG: YybH family protein [Pyrinomonadaceae bacterium]